MFDLSTLMIFVTAALILLITPGPAVLFIVARSVEQGRIAGIVSTLGISAGTLFHVAAAAFGLSALLVSSALAFNIVKYLGAGYLIYLGITTLLRKSEIEEKEIKEKNLKRIFYQGIWVNLMNPKTALFFFAFLPQFVDVSRGSVTLQVLVLGTIFVMLGTFSDGIYALLAGSVGDWLRGNMRFLRAQKYFSGSIYLGLGLLTAFSGSNRK